MEAKAYLNTIRIAPRKVRLVLDLVRGKNAGEALSILKATNRGAAPVVAKLIRSAIANAEHNYNMDVNKLYIKEIYANEGRTLKRMQPHSQGRGFSIFKRTSHIYVCVAEREAN